MYESYCMTHNMKKIEKWSFDRQILFKVIFGQKFIKRSEYGESPTESELKLFKKVFKKVIYFMASSNRSWEIYVTIIWGQNLKTTCEKKKFGRHWNHPPA